MKALFRIPFKTQEHADKGQCPITGTGQKPESEMGAGLGAHHRFFNVACRGRPVRRPARQAGLFRITTQQPFQGFAAGGEDLDVLPLHVGEGFIELVSAGAGRG